MNSQAYTQCVFPWVPHPFQTPSLTPQRLLTRPLAAALSAPAEGAGRACALAKTKVSGVLAAYIRGFEDLQQYTSFLVPSLGFPVLMYSPSFAEV